MALDNTQARIERSVYKSVEDILIREGYWPNLNPITTSKTDWQNAINQIITNKGFSIEPFGHSSNQSKGDRQTPRIGIIPRRVLEGDIGVPVSPQLIASVADPNVIQAVEVPSNSFHIQMDIHLVSSTAKQDRLLHAVLNEAIGTRKFLQFYDSPESRFFIYQYNYYDLPNVNEGEEEKVYSYQVNDVYLTPNKIIEPNVAPIKDITVDIYTSKPGSYNTGTPTEKDDSIFID